MSYVILSDLPVGARETRTRLAMRDGQRKVVLRLVGPTVTPFFPIPVSPAVFPLIVIAQVESQSWAVYDFVPSVTWGELLSALRAQERSLPPQGLVGRVVLDAARAVSTIHRSEPPQPAHGGLSNASVLIGVDGVVRVMDYGVPRPSRFQPPGAADRPSDVFALAAVLHAALTEFPMAYGDALVHQMPLPAPSAVTESDTWALDEVVAKALSPESRNRHEDAGSLADELERALSQHLATRQQLAQLVREYFPERFPDWAPEPSGERRVFIDAASPASPRRDDEITKPAEQPWSTDEITRPDTLAPSRPEPPQPPSPVISAPHFASVEGTAVALGTDSGSPGPAQISPIPEIAQHQENVPPSSEPPWPPNDTGEDFTQPHLDLDTLHGTVDERRHANAPMAPQHARTFDPPPATEPAPPPMPSIPTWDEAGTGSFLSVPRLAAIVIAVLVAALVAGGIMALRARSRAHTPALDARALPPLRDTPTAREDPPTKLPLPPVIDAQDKDAAVETVETLGAAEATADDDAGLASHIGANDGGAEQVVAEVKEQADAGAPAPPKSSKKRGRKRRR